MAGIPGATVRSYGGAMTVTGSCHLLEADGVRVLVDCGAFQGSHELLELNRAPLPFDAGSLDAVLLTHAHLDHSGRLPLLVRAGFRGPIHALPATGALARLLLLDSAHIAEEDAARDRRKGRPVEEPPFGEADVEATVRLVAPAAYGEPVAIGPLRATPRVAGHIPGSASWCVETSGGTIVFSGDLGNARKDVLPDPAPCPPADLVVMEGTYGDRDHRDFDATIDELAQVLTDAAARGGRILVPSFALERTQDVLYHVARLQDEHRIPAFPVYVDSPLAARVEDVYATWRDELSDEVRLVYRNGRDPFAPRRLAYTRSVEESKALNREHGAALVIAGSGMMTGGRILHHLRAHLDDPRTTVVIVGFQPHGGLGRRLVDGAPTVRVLGQEVALRARVVTIGGLSAHADRSELLRWVSTAGDAHVALVHGEPAALRSLRDAIAATGRRAALQPSEVAVPVEGAPHDEGGE